VANVVYQNGDRQIVLKDLFYNLHVYKQVVVMFINKSDVGDVQITVNQSYWGWWWLMFYGHFCAHDRLNGTSDLQR